MTKGLKALKEIVFNYVQVFKNNENGKQMFMEDVHIIEKELKALEIIKEKRVDIGWVIKSANYSRYNLGVGERQALKKEEYELLKEVLQ